jgi:hypothetical protein
LHWFSFSSFPSLTREAEKCVLLIIQRRGFAEVGSKYQSNTSQAGDVAVGMHVVAVGQTISFFVIVASLGGGEI